MHEWSRHCGILPAPTAYSSGTSSWSHYWDAPTLTQNNAANLWKASLAWYGKVPLILGISDLYMLNMTVSLIFFMSCSKLEKDSINSFFWTQPKSKTIQTCKYFHNQFAHWSYSWELGIFTTNVKYSCTSRQIRNIHVHLYYNYKQITRKILFHVVLFENLI